MFSVLCNDALSGEGRIAVEQEWKHFRALLSVLANALSRARDALHDGIYRFEVAWVRA
jgi:hypothetical protein